MPKKIQYSVELDYLLSLYRYFNKNKEIHAEEEKAEIWKDYLNRTELLFVKNDLSIFFSSLPFVWFLCGFLRKQPFSNIKLIDKEHFFTFMNAYIDTEELNGEELYAQLKAYLSGEITTTEGDYMIFHEAVFNTDRFLSRLNHAISLSYEIFRTEIMDKEVKKAIQTELQHHQKQRSVDEKWYTGFIKRLDTSIPEKKLKDIDMYMLHFSSGIYLFTTDLSFSVFSSGMPEYFKKMNAQLDISDFLKTLSDPTRFKLVTQLAEKEYFGAELAKALDVTTATISHHIDRIKKLKLLKLRRGEQSKIYYSLSKDMLERYIETLKTQLLGGCK